MTNPADDIRRKMQNIRHELSEDVEGLAQSTREMTNWRSYVKRYPWLCLGAAVSAGMFVVPKRVEQMTPDVDTLLKLAKKNKLVIETNPKTQARGSLAGTALSLLGTLALRGAMAYAGNHFGKVGGEAAAKEFTE